MWHALLKSDRCKDGVATVTLNKPPHNAVDEELDEELSEIFVDLNRDPDVRVVKLQSSGQSFCGGGNLQWVAETADTIDQPGWLRSMRRGRRILLSIMDLDAPVVVKVDGPAVGLGATLALCCDIVIASEDAFFSDPHVLIGLTAGDGGAILWPHLIGYARAKRYLLTGARISGREAADMGLISECVSADSLEQTVDELVSKLAALPFFALSTTKRAVNNPLLREAVTTMDASLGLETMSRMHIDHRARIGSMHNERRSKKGGRG